MWKVVWVCGSRRGLRAKLGDKMVDGGAGVELLLLGAGCLGQQPDVRGGPDVRAVGPDVRARDPWTNSKNTAWRGQIRGKIWKISWMEIREKWMES